MFEDDRLCRNPNCGWKMVTNVGPPRGSRHWECKNPECGRHAIRISDPNKLPEEGDTWTHNYVDQPLKVEIIQPTQDGKWWVFASPMREFV